MRVIVIEPGAVATALTDHINHAETKRATDRLYEDVAITAEDIAFAVQRP